MVRERRTRPRVLVIDDEEGPRASVRMVLKYSFDVVCCASVDEGVAELRRQPPSVVIMDIRMPDKGGIEGLREIRAIDPLVSVVMFTGYGALESAKEAMRHGANDYIEKPADANALLDIVLRYAERTEMQRRRHHAEEELHRLNEQLLTDLQRKDHLAELGQASAEFLHDLRNPLTIVLGYVQLLSEQLGGVRDAKNGAANETTEYLDAIEKNVHRCQELTQLWQGFGRVDLARLEPVAIGPLLTEVAMAVVPLAEPQRARVENKIDCPATAVVSGSRAQLLRALHNIVSNAIQAVADDGSGRIVLTCNCRGGEAVIVVTDNGRGIEKEHLERIFEPYFTTKAAGKGTGLGLAITRKIIEEHHGRISVSSRVGQGSVFEIRLPLV